MGLPTHEENSSPTLANVSPSSTGQKPVIAFDMDGVLIDSADSIASSLHKALAELQVPVNSEFNLRSHVGKPLEQLILLASSTQLSSESIAACVQTYRRFNDEISVADLPTYPGVIDMLKRSAEHFDLCVLTTKNERSAKRQMAMLDLSQYFLDVFGTLDDRWHASKDVRWQEAESQLKRDGRTKISLIVGDRASDIVAAKRVGRLAIGATWGYAESGELHNVAADRIASHPSEVPSLLQELRI